MGVGPFVLEGSDHPFGLAVPAWRVGRWSDVLGADPGEDRFESPGVSVDHRVVGHHHHRFRRLEAELSEVLERSLERVSVGVGVLLVVLFDIEVTAVIVDDDM